MSAPLRLALELPLFAGTTRGKCALACKLPSVQIFKNLLSPCASQGLSREADPPFWEL